jgi:hypothetical protein
MPIQYRTDKPTQDGWYLVMLDDKEFCVAEATVFRDGEVNWSQTGADYDQWSYGTDEHELAVICKLDLESIAAGVKQIADASEKRRIVAIFDIWPGFENSPLSWFAETISSRMTDAVSLKFAEITDTQEVERKVRGTT